VPSVPIEIKVDNLIKSINTMIPPVVYPSNPDIKIDQSWSLMDIVNKKPPLGWLELFKECYNDLIRIDSELKTKGEWFPLKEDLFRAYELTPLPNVNVVIIGQDPYFGKNNGLPIGTGLSFSTRKGNPIPPSLNNVFKVLEKTVAGFKRPYHGDLTNWTKQGVLLLNKCLTVSEGKAGSHKNLWSEPITRTIYHIDRVNPKCVYILWGNPAQELSKIITSKYILTSSHPSPQAAYRGFMDNDHFNECNKILIDNGKVPIDWNLD
jgi:uracil-DNA glycosylase